jgi:hypothetical protein
MPAAIAVALATPPRIAYVQVNSSRRTGRTNHAEPAVKPRPPRRRKPPAKDVLPPDVPEVVSTAAPKPENDADLLPEHIRRMLEAAYT